jgi:hypothetical protein
MFLQGKGNNHHTVQLRGVTSRLQFLVYKKKDSTNIELFVRSELTSLLFLEDCWEYNYSSSHPMQKI